MPNGVDPLSNQQLQWGYWYVTHRAQLLRALKIFLLLFCIGTWGYSLTRLAYLFIVEEPRTALAVAALPHDLVNVRARERYIASDVQILEVGVFPSADGRADFYARIQNPNADYAIPSLTYTFFHDNGETQRQKGYLLPGAEMYLYALGVEAPQVPRNPQLIIESAGWRRVIGWEEKRTKTFDLAAENVAVQTASDGGGSLVTFALHNKTTYNFWTVDVPMVLLQGTRTVGVNIFHVEKLQSGERRSVAFQWFGAPAATSIRVVPQANVLDQSVFMEQKRGEQRF